MRAPTCVPGLAPALSLPLACVTCRPSGTIVIVIANILSQIPFPVWLAIGFLLAALAWNKIKLTIGRSKGAMPAPRDVRKAGKEGEWNKLNEHHHPLLRGSRASMATDPHARLLAPSMPYALCNGDPVNALKVSNPAEVRGMLKRDWHITDRDEMITQLYSLLRDGHREDFSFLRGRCASQKWTEAEVSRLRKTADVSTDDWERLWRIQRFQANDRGIQHLDFAAWDFIRAAMLTRAGAGVGWLSEDEAFDTLALINRALQSCYSSWEEAWEAFRTTRWLWAAEGETQGAADDLHDRNRGEFLLGARGLWTAIPWDAPYPTPRFLLLDALADLGALRLLSSVNWEDASSWEKELDTQARTRAPMSVGGKPIVN